MTQAMASVLIPSKHSKLLGFDEKDISRHPFVYKEKDWYRVFASLGAVKE